MTDVRELLPLYALGILEADEATIVDQAIAKDAALAAELAGYQSAAAQLIVPESPGPEVKARLLASVGGGRFEQRTSRMASLFDVSVDRARELLGLIERPASWTQEMPGIALVHFDGGAAYAAADCGFIRLEPGAVFPSHRHVGDEVTVVLQGTLRDSSGRMLQPGDELVQAAGSQHELVCEGSEPCIFAARAMDGIEIGGVSVRPNKPSL
ncbi:MAG: cupin domain-containing protein [Deltaproteobacteria bacterium]|nr:cupin domain-containing protein [Deltaproteobacteria bacterium]MDQ3295952.1 cupin domain-containing protein [Myxococcota bacterium]